MASRPEKSNRSDHGDGLDDPAEAPASASCPTSRKRQRSRSRERARTGLWGDGQEQPPGRNGMVVASHRGSPPLEPLPETTTRSSCCSPVPLTRPSPPPISVGKSRDASSSDRLSVVDQEEEVARELGHRMAFLSRRGHDENLLSLMDEAVYEDDVMNDDYSSPYAWQGAPEVDFRALRRVNSSGDVVREEEEEDYSEAYRVPCDPVADRVPIAVDEEEELDEEVEGK